MALVYDSKLAKGFSYIPEGERGEKDGFSVTIRPIDSVRLVQLEDGLLKRGQDNSLTISTGSYNVSLCQGAIVGWSNIQDADGKQIEIVLGPNGYIAEESLCKLSTALINEIAGVIASTSQDPSNIQLFTAEVTS